MAQNSKCIIIKHGIQWLLGDSTIDCPDCKISISADNADIKYSEVVETIIFSMTEEAVFTATFSCKHCGCNWRIVRPYSKIIKQSYKDEIKEEIQ